MYKKGDNFESRAEQSRAEQSRAENIDILKAICAFLIVCIHIPFPGTMGEYFTALTRIAVPIFFMITGYFYSGIIRKNKEKKQIKKIFRLFIEANFLYFVWKLLLSLVQGKLEVIAYIKSLFNAKSLFKFVFLNDSPVGGHLWYLGAILYVLIVVFLIDKLNLRKVLYCLTPLLLSADLVLGKYSLLIFHREFPYILVRNFLCVGIPYFCIGNIIREKRCSEKWNKKVLRVLILVFAITSLVERFVLVNAGLNATRDHYISTTFLSICLFVYALKSNWNNKRLAMIGREYSTWIYIIHPIFITIFEFNEKACWYSLYKCVAPMVIYFISMTFVVVLRKIEMKQKCMKNN